MRITRRDAHLPGYYPLSGLGQNPCDPTDPAYDPNDPSCGASAITTSGLTNIGGEIVGGAVEPTPPSLPTYGTTTSTSTSSGGLTAAQLATALAAGGTAAATAIKATQTPYVIPGTNVIYNPATGQLSGGILGSTSVSAGSISLMGLGLVAILIFAMMSGGRR